jgi:hypothetical protein
MELSNLAISLIIEELEERAKEAEADYKDNKNNQFKQGYYEAYFEVLEIIQNRKDL